MFTHVICRNPTNTQYETYNFCLQIRWRLRWAGEKPTTNECPNISATAAAATTTTVATTTTATTTAAATKTTAATKSATARTDACSTRP